MSKATIEELIPDAIRELESVFGDAEIKSVYQGYISSFGVGIVQVGLLPTLAYFESEQCDEENADRTKNKPKGDRRIISDLVHDTLGIEAETLLRHAVTLSDKEQEMLKEEIRDASVALKLSMRLFDLGKGGQS